MRVTDAIDMLEELLAQIGDVEVVFSGGKGQPIRAVEKKTEHQGVLSQEHVEWINHIHGRN